MRNAPALSAQLETLVNFEGGSCFEGWFKGARDDINGGDFIL